MAKKHRLQIFGERAEDTLSVNVEIYLKASDTMIFLGRRNITPPAWTHLEVIAADSNGRIVVRG